MDLIAMIPDAAGDPGAASRAIRLFWATIGLIGLVFFGFLLLMTLRRAARRRSHRAGARGGGTPASDAWTESAKRIRIPFFEGDADPDDDTIDFDPDGDRPGRS